MGDKNKHLYDICDKIARNFYKRNRYLCRVGAYSIDDLRQEAKIYVWKMSLKYPNLDTESLKKMASQTASWRLKTIKKFCLDPDIKALLGDDKRKKGETPDNDTLFNPLFSNIHTCRKNPIYNFNMIMDDIKQFCTEREFKVIYEFLVNGKNFAEISREMNITRQGIKFIYDKALDKIKKNTDNLLFTCHFRKILYN